MENASKALIIAGAILVSILLISVGVLIMNSTGDTQKSVEDQSKAIAIRTFNAQFTPYEGEDISASQVRTLFSTIEASNATNTDHTVDIDTSSGCITKSSQVKANKKYTVDLDYSGGYVKTITIKPN